MQVGGGWLGSKSSPTKPSKIVPVSHLPTPEDRPPRPGRGQKESKVLDAEGGLAQSAADDLTTGAGTEQKNGATSRSPAAPGLEVQLKTKPKPAHDVILNKTLYGFAVCGNDEVLGRVHEGVCFGS